MSERQKTTAATLLIDYGFWPIEKTFYETQRFGNSAATYRFGCHQQHTSFTIKIDIAQFIEATTPQ